MPATSAIRLAPRILILAVLLWLSSASLGEQAIVIDNRDEAHTWQTGGWRTSSGEFPYLEDSVYSVNNDQTFIWNPELPHNGDWEVYAWWTYHPNRSTDVPYRIVGDEDFTDVTVFVNQRDRYLSGRWILLGQFSFYHYLSDPEVSVSVSSENGQAAADAVKFVYVEGPKEWPEIRCPCDEYFSRAAVLYVGWGGSFDTQGSGDADVLHECSDIIGDTRTNFRTTLHAGTEEEKWVSLRFKDTGSDSEWNPSRECGVSVGVSNPGVPGTNNVYDKYRSYLANRLNKTFDACYASVTNYCLQD